MQRLISLIFTAAVVSRGFAQDTMSPRDQLKQYVSQLQSNPYDDALRENLIKLAAQLEPKPPVPEEVDELVGRAKAAMASAQSEADYTFAIDAFQKALQIAPWEGAFYYNLAVVQAKAGKHAEAIANFKWYLLAVPDADDAREVRQRIGELKFMQEKAGLAQREQDEAVNRERLRQENFQNFRRLVEGRSYEYSACAGLPEWDPPKRQTIAGCNWEQYNGKNWVLRPGISKGWENWNSYTWRFNSEYASFLRQGDGAESLRAKSVGPTLNDIVFESKNYLADPDNPPWERINFLRRNDDFSSFTIGWTPSSDAPTQFPEKRYHYTWYKAVN